MKVEVTHIPYSEVVNDELLQGNIDNDEYHGFLEDYRTLHCLLRKYKPKSVFEVGCNMGVGTKIIKNAVGENSQVYSLDLPFELAHISLQSPVSEGKGDSVGHRCDLPFTLLREDSMAFDYSKYPCEAVYIDGEHDYSHPNHETKESLNNKPKLLVWHDSDIDVVYNGVIDAFSESKEGKNYQLYRVDGTRILYAVRK